MGKIRAETGSVGQIPGHMHTVHPEGNASLHK
jgi:hypothetical protein